MKKLILLILLSFFGLSLLIKVGIKPFDKISYIDNNVLDMTTPLNVNIYEEFLTKLAPAYEQQ